MRSFVTERILAKTCQRIKNIVRDISKSLAMNEDLIAKYIKNGGHIFTVRSIDMIRDGGTISIATSPNAQKLYIHSTNRTIHSAYPPNATNVITDPLLVNYVIDRIQTFTKRYGETLHMYENIILDLKKVHLKPEDIKLDEANIVKVICSHVAREGCNPDCDHAKSHHCLHQESYCVKIQHKCGCKPIPDSRMLKHEWLQLSSIPPDEFVEVMDVDGNMGVARPTYYPFDIDHKPGDENKPYGFRGTVVHHPNGEMTWDGGWIIHINLCESNRVGEVVKWRPLIKHN